MIEHVYAHFIGVGGAGMSGIARVLHDRGISVSGSDLKDSRYARALRETGIPVAIGHDADNLGDPEVVVVSSAIPETNPELVEAHRRGLPVWPRAMMLAHLAEERRTIAVAGTHGKTTTSSMAATMLANMGLAPTFLIGGEVCAYGTNAMCGEGPHYVVEADESDGSLVYLDPFISVITNIEADHLDHYGTVEAVEERFAQFVEKTDEDGAAVVCADDSRALAIASSCKGRVLSYGMAEDADVRCSAIASNADGHRFRVSFPGGLETEASMRLPGIHNVSNATAVLAVAYVLGLDIDAAAAALGRFAGVKRRYDLVGEVNGVKVVDDYAHHPTEVRATLAAAKEGGASRIWVVFQPHRYSRTEALGREFGSAFGDADRLVLMDVYSAGETPIPGVTGKTIVDAVLVRDARSRVAWLPHRWEVAPFLARFAKAGDLVITMGAGDVTTVGSEILRALGGEEVSQCR